MTEALDAEAIVAGLHQHGVRCVVIGAFAAIVQGAPIPPTRDIDFTPDSTPGNLKNLSNALKVLGAKIRTDAVDGGLAFDHDGRSLGAAKVWNFVCRFGEFDVTFAPSGFPGGYEELVTMAHETDIGGVPILVADLSDVIRSKEAAGRPKDLRVLPILYRFDRERGGGEVT